MALVLSMPAGKETQQIIYTTSERSFYHNCTVKHCLKKRRKLDAKQNCKKTVQVCVGGNLCLLTIWEVFPNFLLLYFELNMYSIQILSWYQFQKTTPFCPNLSLSWYCEQKKKHCPCFPSGKVWHPWWSEKVDKGRGLQQEGEGAWQEAGGRFLRGILWTGQVQDSHVWRR